MPRDIVTTAVLQSRASLLQTRVFKQPSRAKKKKKATRWYNIILYVCVSTTFALAGEYARAFYDVDIMRIARILYKTLK